MYYDQRLSSLCCNSGRWWSGVNEITGRVRPSCSLQGLANRLCDGNMSVLAGDINNFLESVTRKFVPITDQDSSAMETSNEVPDNFIICVDEVEKETARIKVNTATGPDNIPSCRFKEGACPLVPPVCAVFNSSYVSFHTYAGPGIRVRVSRARVCNKSSSLLYYVVLSPCVHVRVRIL